MAPRRQRTATFRAQRENFFCAIWYFRIQILVFALRAKIFFDLKFQNPNFGFFLRARAHVPHDFPKNRKKIFAATTPHLDSFSITRTPWPNVTRRFAALQKTFFKKKIISSTCWFIGVNFTWKMFHPVEFLHHPVNHSVFSRLKSHNFF